MKVFLIIIFSLFLFNLSSAQNDEQKSDLRIKIDSIIKFDIGYIIDSTTDKMPKYEWDTTKFRGLPPAFSTFPPNPMTIIVLNGDVVNINELNKYKLSQIEILEIFKKNDNKAMAIYGTRAKNGLILIQSKKFKKRNKRKLRRKSIPQQ